MSMNTYPLEHSHAFLLDDDAAAMVIIKHDMKDGELPPEVQEIIDTYGIYRTVTEHLIPDEFMDEYEDIQFAWEILTDEIDEIGFAPSFAGEIETVFEDKCSETAPKLQLNYNDDLIVYIIPEKGPSYFEKAYDSPEDMYEEFKRKLEDWLPAEFPIWNHIVSIYGTYFC